MKAKIIGSEPTIDYRPADDLEPQFEKLKEKYRDLAETDEDVLSIALFENVAVKFLQNKNNRNSRLWNSISTLAGEWHDTRDTA